MTGSLDLSYVDLAIVIGYLTLITTVGVIKGREARTLADFAVGSRNFPTIILLAATFATLIDANSTMGLASKSFSVGFVYFEICIAFVISRLLIAFVLAPKMAPFLGSLSSGDVMGKLYGQKAQTLTGISVILASIIWTGGQVRAIGYLFNYFFGFPEDLGIITGGLIVMLYSIRGGIKAIAFTDVIQFGVLIIVIPVLAGLAVVKAGGISHLFSQLPDTHLALTPSSGSLWNHFGIVLIATLPGIYPSSMQRILMARSVTQLKKTFFSTALICLPFYVCVACIGLVALVDSPNMNPHLAMPSVIASILPLGLRGFAIAGLLAVIMSTVDSHINMAAVAFSHDVLLPIRKAPLQDKTILRIARICALSIGVLSIGVATFFKSGIDAMFAVMFVGYPLFFPPMFLGIMGLRTNPKAFWAAFIATASTQGLYFMFAPLDFTASAIGFAVNCSILFALRTKQASPSPADKQSTFTLHDFDRHTQPIKARRLDARGLHDYLRQGPIFSWFIIINCVAPFFIWSTDISNYVTAYLLACFLCASLSFVLLFREYFDTNAKQQQLLWRASIFTYFTTQTTFMLIQSVNHSLWLLSLPFAFTLLALIADKIVLRTTATAIVIVGTFTVYLANGASIAPASEQLAYLAMSSNIGMLVICAMLLLKKDVIHLQSLGGALAHEAGRSISSMHLGAQRLADSLPMLLENY